MPGRNAPRSRGFTLIEVLVSTALLIAVAAGVSHLIGLATVRGHAARAQTAATILAAGKLEQLRALAWGFEDSFEPPPIERSDRETDLSAEPPAGGGPGLSLSPRGTLGRNTAPYFEYLDARGRWAGSSSPPPAAAVFVRRWAVSALAGGDARTIVLQVLVVPIAEDRARGTRPWQGPAGQEALLTTIRTRRGQ